MSTTFSMAPASAAKITRSQKRKIKAARKLLRERSEQQRGALVAGQRLPATAQGIQDSVLLCDAVLRSEVSLELALRERSFVSSRAPTEDEASRSPREEAEEGDYVLVDLVEHEEDSEQGAGWEVV